MSVSLLVCRFVGLLLCFFAAELQETPTANRTKSEGKQHCTSPKHVQPYPHFALAVCKEEVAYVAGTGDPQRVLIPPANTKQPSQLTEKPMSRSTAGLVLGPLTIIQENIFSPRINKTWFKPDLCTLQPAVPSRSSKKIHSFPELHREEGASIGMWDQGFGPPNRPLLDVPGGFKSCPVRSDLGARAPTAAAAAVRGGLWLGVRGGVVGGLGWGVGLGGLGWDRSNSIQMRACRQSEDLEEGKAHGS